MRHFSSPSTPSGSFAELWHFAGLAESIASAEVVRIDDHPTGLDALDPLTPGEAAYVQKAVRKRIVEFRAGRHCARRALAQLGLSDCEILAHANRAPIWPHAIVGSITHCTEVAAAAVARTSQVRGLGIDAEVNDELEPKLWPLILTAEEHDWLERLDPAAGAGKFAKVIFSAKESFFKAQFPLTHKMIDFQAIEIAKPIAFADHGILKFRIIEALPPYFASDSIVSVFFLRSPTCIRTAMVWQD